MQYFSGFIFNLYKLFPAFICANNIKSLVNNLFGVTSSSLSSGGMSDKSTDFSLSLFLLYQPIIHF